jgi:uncharacterized protein
VSRGKPVVQELWRYPVKSLRGERLEAASLDWRGIVDRAFAICDATGRFGSGKTTRRFRLLRDLFEFRAETEGDGVVVHGPDGMCIRVGDPELDALLTARYGEPLAVRQEGAIPHFDAGAVHVLTTSSLGWVEARYGQTGSDARRYRPNVILETSDAGLIEQRWLGATLSIGSCAIRVIATVERCVTTNSAQDDLPQDNGVLRFLTRENQAMLGVYADVVAPEEIRVGDLVTVASDQRLPARSAF